MVKRLGCRPKERVRGSLIRKAVRVPLRWACTSNCRCSGCSSSQRAGMTMLWSNAAGSAPITRFQSFRVDGAGDRVLTPPGAFQAGMISSKKSCRMASRPTSKTRGAVASTGAGLGIRRRKLSWGMKRGRVMSSRAMPVRSRGKRPGQRRICAQSRAEPPPSSNSRESPMGRLRSTGTLAMAAGTPTYRAPWNQSSAPALKSRPPRKSRLDPSSFGAPSPMATWARRARSRPMTR
ncbi:MAG: hypothetical protein BWY56_02604 [Acidobacteria bacterium ADurb.Bin340]|nr:MAG: hypothetical protein BWY56_02604 [Acidobacteria bacterium ADurb.Bin340]